MNKPSRILGMAGNLQRGFYNRALLWPIHQPEVMIAHAADKFDAQGQWLDTDTRQRIGQLLEVLARLTQRPVG